MAGGASALLLPCKTIFLPPRRGWPIYPSVPDPHPFHAVGCIIEASSDWDDFRRDLDERIRYAFQVAPEFLRANELTPGDYIRIDGALARVDRITHVKV